MIDIKPEVIRLFAESKYRRKHPNIANSVNGNISDVEKESMKGAKFFKEKTLGIFGEEKIINIEQLAKTIYESNLADSLSSAKSLIPDILDVNIKYEDIPFFGVSYLRIERMGKRYQSLMYKISIWDFE
mgnify:CR=1 FL=1